MTASTTTPLRRWLKRIALTLLLLLVLTGTAGGLYAYTEVSAYEQSVQIVYDVKPVPLARSSDPAVLARGEHLARSIGGCALTDCHGADLAGGKAVDAGPVGVIVAPNITPRGRAAGYSDAELGRLIRHGIKKDGRTVRFMPVQDNNWLPHEDVVALVSYVRQVPPADRPSRDLEIGLLGKLLDRHDQMQVDIARRIDHAQVDKPVPVAPAPTTQYGALLSRLCSGCHGTGFSGGPLPGAPPDFPVPSNLTPHATGLSGWTFEDFQKLAREGVRKNGKKVDPFMPTEAIGNMNDVEQRALWAYLQSLPAKPFGGR